MYESLLSSEYEWTYGVYNSLLYLNGLVVIAACILYKEMHVTNSCHAVGFGGYTTCNESLMDQSFLTWFIWYSNHKDVVQFHMCHGSL